VDEVPGDDAGRDDDLASALAKAAPRHWWNRATIVLGALVLIVGGFLGGIQAQKHWGTTTTAATGRAGGFGGAGAGGYPNFAGGTGRGQFAGGTGNAAAGTGTPAAAGTTGTVKLVDGNTIYVTTADGATVIVKTTGKTTVSTAAKGSLKDIKAGQTVTVQGATGSDGSVAATSVTSTGK
jgi:hypothetical protein